MHKNQIRVRRIAALYLSSSVFALSPAMASSFSVGGGMITTTDNDGGGDLTGTGGPFILAPNGGGTATGDVITITGVSITNTDNSVTGRAIDIGGLNPTTASYSVIVHGSTLKGSDNAGLWIGNNGGTISFDSTGGAANHISGTQGIAVINTAAGGNVSIKTGADIVTTTGAFAGEVLHGATTGTGTISIDSVGAILTGGGTYGISAVTGGSGAITIGGANGGIASTINVANGYGIFVTSVSSVINVTLASTGSIAALNGMSLQGGITTVDSFGTIIATNDAIDAHNAGPLFVTLEQGSATNGRILGSGTDDTIKLMTGANISGANFDGGGGTDLVNLSGSGTGTLDVSTATNFSTILKDGSGTWTLTRSGAAGISNAAITLNAGTLVADSNAMSGNVASAAGSVLQFNQAANGIYAGVISGNGSVTKTGGGLLVLSGGNNYTGGTTIVAGTLQLGASGALPNGGALIINGGSFDLNGFTQTVGALSGSGGGITLGAGQLTTNGSATTTLSSTISGSGSLIKAGSGTLILAANNNYAGGTTISSGTLQVGSGTSGIVAGNILNNASLVFDRSDDVVFSGVISGSGTVSQLGSGTLTLTGNSLYTGTTAVNSGRLNVTGAIASSAVTVAGGATLAGTGKVGAVNITSGGTLSPGVGTPGVLAVAGNLSLASGATYVDNFNLSSASLTSVTGSASLNGNLVANGVAGTYSLGQRYTLLTATGGISGSFASLTTTGLSNIQRGLLSYDSNDVFLTIMPNALSPLLPADATANQRTIAGGIDAALQSGAGLPSGFSSLFNLSGNALGGALNQLSSEIGADASQAAAQAAAPFLDLLMRSGLDNSDVMAGVPNGVRPAQLQTGALRVWGAAYGGHSAFGADATTGAQRLSTGAMGVAAGIETRIDDNLLVGGSLAGSSETFSLAGGQSQGISSDIMVGIYAHESVMDRGYLSGALAYGSHNVGTERSAAISGTDILKAKFIADDFSGRAEGGYRFGLEDGFALTPYIAFAGENFSSPAYSERALSGASTFALSYAAQDFGQVHSEFGARLGRDFDAGSDILSAELNAGWAHQIQDDAISHASFQNLAGASFAVSGVAMPEDSALLGLGLLVKSRDGVTGGAHIQSQFGSGLTALSGTIDIGFSW